LRFTSTVYANANIWQTINIKPMTTLLLIGICIVLTGILSFAWAYAINYHARRKAQEEEYERKYNWIQCRILSDQRTISNYKSIERALICLAHLPYRNKEKTCVLSVELWDKWSEQRNQIRDEKTDEFSPEETFRKS
jgi:hypothetical protein